MIITQENIIKQLSEKENINTATIRRLFKGAENIIFEYLSTTSPSEDIIVKFITGVNFERKYIETKNYSKGMFQNINCPEHVKIKANLSKYYIRQVNKKLFTT